MIQKYLLIFSLSLVLFLGMGTSMFAQDSEAVAQDKAADESRDILKKTPAPLLELLKLTPQEAAQTTRGKKLKVFEIGLDNLQQYKPGDNPQKILIDRKEIVYPIYLARKLKTAISIRKGGGKWRNASIGGKEIHFIEPVRMKHSIANKINTTAYFIARVPAMYLSFLGYRSKGRYYFIPTYDHPDVKLTVGEAMPAENVYAKLKPLVGKYRGVLKPPKQQK